MWLSQESAWFAIPELPARLADGAAL